ncbi:DUF885 domain-containing protein [Motilibacter aurantiacus]|uniref:DUF885 domain-containing protein n=1 Tax=Motilibacter aurantiacus TaxID=2714955 RepID=UPI00140AA06E|nr:DUF885 domain-containing protein [Motilibacter aurantiacus]
MPVPTGPRPFDALAAQLVADTLEAAPTLGTAVGLTEYDENLPDLSAEAVAARERREDSWLDRLDALAAPAADAELLPEERVDRDLARMRLRGARVMRDWAEWRRNPDQYAGTALQGVFGLLLHRLRPEAELADAVAARLRAVPRLLEQGAANLDPGLAAPQLLRRSLGMVAAGVTYARAVAGELPEAYRPAVAEAGEAAAVAFERFGAVVEDLAGRATGGWAIGEERYDALLRQAEGLGYGAREMRDKGQAAYDEIAADMRAITRGLRGDDDWRAAVEQINEDAPATPEEMLERYREATAAARAFCVERGLVTMPAGERCEVVPSAPFNRASLAVAHYVAPPPFAGRGVGHFFVPYPPDGAPAEQVRQRLMTNSREGLWAIAVHEAYPGHHWHFATVAASRLRPLRGVLGSTYFVEGWGLYTEELMREQGFYATPQQELAQRDMRLFRASRIVVDTSLHLGEMTVEQAVEHMSTKSSLSLETARAEVLRYCAWPTQASSYLTGALEIRRMRDRWLAEGRGTLREFHDGVAASGRMPISLVERTVFDEAAEAAA